MRILVSLLLLFISVFGSLINNKYDVNSKIPKKIWQTAKSHNITGEPVILALDWIL